jgi:uncharacterized protein YbjT (DUF2867 family)
MNSLKIAVHGATGSQGSAVVRQLLDTGNDVRAIARNSAGPHGVAADLSDVDSLVAAYTDADAVVLQLPLVFNESAVTQARSALAALEKAAVPRVVFNTNGGIPDAPIGVPFVDARALLRTELPNVVETVAIVAPAATYAENLAAPWSAPLIAAGEVVYPLPADAPIPWVVTADVAAVIAESLIAPTPTPVQLIAGPADLTGPDVAAALGESVRWRTITPRAYAELLRPYLGAEAAVGIAASYENPPPAPDPATVLRGPTSLRDWATGRNWV